MKPVTALLRLSQFDAPPAGAPDATAFEMRVIRRVSVAGMAEVLLCALRDPLDLDDGTRVTHVAVSPRLRGETLTDAPFGNRAANLAYVTAHHAAGRRRLTDADVRSAVIGVAQGIPRKLGWAETLLRRLTGRAVPA